MTFYNLRTRDVSLDKGLFIFRFEGSYEHNIRCMFYNKIILLIKQHK